MPPMRRRWRAMRPRRNQPRGRSKRFPGSSTANTFSSSGASAAALCQPRGSRNTRRAREAASRVPSRKRTLISGQGEGARGAVPSPAAGAWEGASVAGEGAGAEDGREASAAEDEAGGADRVDAGEQPADVRAARVAARDAHQVVDAVGRMRGGRGGDGGREEEGHGEQALAEAEPHARISIIIGRRRRKA